jgi:hypothetical protein
VIDFGNPGHPKLTDIVMDFNGEGQGEITDVKICSEQGFLFLANVELHTVEMYHTVKRTNPGPPQHISNTPTSLYPEKLLPNANCTILAVVHELETDLLYGEVTLIRKLDTPTPHATKIPLDSAHWGDDYILRKGLHMPLTKNAMQYWDTLSSQADEIDFSKERSNYRSSLFLEGESMAWTPNQEELLVNLQSNNGLLRIDVAHDRPSDLAGYGLKEHAQVSIDINSQDQECRLLKYPNLFSMRNPDSIETFRYNGKSYVMTANEGRVRKYNGFSDSVKIKDLFVVSILPGVC